MNFIQQAFAQYLIQSNGFNVDETKGEIRDKSKVPGLQGAVLDEVYLSFFGLDRQKMKRTIVYALNLRNP